jgi:hypothetical protein
VSLLHRGEHRNGAMASTRAPVVAPGLLSVRRMFRTGLAVLVLAGCYATGQVTPQALRSVAGPLNAPRLIEGERLEPTTMVRAELADGSLTGWFQASGLRVSDEGLMAGDPRPGGGARSAPGVRWSEARRFELRSLEPGWSALTIPFFPFVLLAAKLDPDGFSRAGSPTDGEGEGAPPLRMWADRPTQPLFTGAARRRAIVQGLATADVQGTYRGDLAAGLALGLRFRNFYELSVVGRPLSIAGVDHEGGRANVMAFGGSMGLHVDPDGDGRLAFYLGIEVVGTHGPLSVSAFQLKWGPRLGLGHALFLTASPLNLANLQVSGAGQPSWALNRVVSSVELGGTL